MCGNPNEDRVIRVFLEYGLVPGLLSSDSSFRKKSSVVIEPVKEPESSKNSKKKQHVSRSSLARDKPVGEDNRGIGRKNIVFKPRDETDSDSEFHDSEYELDDGDDDFIFEKNVKCGVEVDGGGINAGECSRGRAGVRANVTVEDTIGVCHDEEGSEKEQLQFSDDRFSLEGSDSEEVSKPRKRSTWSQFNSSSDMEDPVFCVGMLFESKKVLKEAIKMASIKDRVNVKIVKNDKLRFKAACKEECSWQIYASKFSSDEDDKTFQIKTYNSVHVCSKDWENRNISSKWLGEKYIDCFLADPSLSIPSFEQLVYRDYFVIVPHMTLWRAKQHALKKLEGSYESQYGKIGRYAAEMRRADPKCSVLCKLDAGIFQRLFVSLGACIEEMKYCRPIIGIDGCFLKGKYGGQLLAAIGMDANDCIFPIAFAIVEVESTETWTWFVTPLKEQLNMENPYS